MDLEPSQQLLQVIWESDFTTELSPAMARIHLPAWSPEKGTASTCRAEAGTQGSAPKDLAAVIPLSPMPCHCTAAPAGTSTTSGILQDCPGTGRAPLPTV